MSKIHIKLLSENALAHMKKNIDVITKKIQENEDNKWIYSEFPEKMFIEKKYEIDDFKIIDNPESKDKEIDLTNSITIFNSLKVLPRYVLTDERFWLWLHLEKFYNEVKSMMTVKGTSTVLDHWMHKQGTRRGLMFGVLSRCYYRVAFTVDESLTNKYELTKWVIENPERFRNLTWRSFSSEEHLVRGIIKGEKKAIDENPSLEKNDIYPEIAKYVSIIGSVRLLDVISEEDIAEMICSKTKELLA
ncbi:MAG: DUF6339 family protein [Anaeroplasma sp.]|uniref:DUF6339 family protein n=1 Tax=Anaeroplasma sp. TaxID=1872523 RepID=UPI002A9168B8|nr:DUF6339 family protein [Anaeroplasma sp.]MDY5983259.1 DUF6339 family protein [Anaeroplasma sp.]